MKITLNCFHKKVLVFYLGLTGINIEKNSLSLDAVEISDAPAISKEKIQIAIDLFLLYSRYPPLNSFVFCKSWMLEIATSVACDRMQYQHTISHHSPDYFCQMFLRWHISGEFLVLKLLIIWKLKKKYLRCRHDASFLKVWGWELGDRTTRKS